MGPPMARRAESGENATAVTRTLALPVAAIGRAGFSRSQTRTFACVPLVASSFPSQEKTIDARLYDFPRRTTGGSLGRTRFHTITVRRSDATVATRVRSGEIAAVKNELWPLSTASAALKI